MRDQAESLRLQLNRRNEQSATKAIAITSGKGGVGKSNVSLNFSIMLSKRGFRVLLLDMDIGMGNIDILLGQSSHATIIDLFYERFSLYELIKNGPENISFIAGGTGLANIFTMDEEKVDFFLTQLQLVSEQYDYLIFDMGAGISEDRLRLLKAVHEIFIVTTPEPTAMTDAYAMMKYVHMQEKNIPFYVIVNRAQTDQEGRDTLRRLKSVAKQFLNKDIIPLGVLPEDRSVYKAVVRQTPFLLFDPASKISRAMYMLTDRYLSARAMDEERVQRSFNFFARLRHFLLER
ncbi:MinD/ParA family protein [Parageobacillus toebii NBRC 107807]|uniref:Flagellar biosynthesis protein FlhG n=1 Tax=Parageobacillus toebii NBRC 107807 TaxID=1223503 RepID=A0A6G9J319_9BACL|nr:MinD/ParA family protein [Parageobacillus toebii]MBB3867874.1 flagellar biosynthesis protein FlhG [Parageobacillus toebii NBRC 107807]QIQ33128.1 MinD/ParA family protein [Parageobacillus toebii NBRC 107807]QSB48196.1 MinD/ParA family protein [Parageobacillus toebii]WMT17957.1 MinD/ParA family protein [Parageobacillus toebii]